MRINSTVSKRACITKAKYHYYQLDNTLPTARYMSIDAFTPFLTSLQNDPLCRPRIYQPIPRALDNPPALSPLPSLPSPWGCKLSMLPASSHSHTPTSKPNVQRTHATPHICTSHPPSHRLTPTKQTYPPHHLNPHPPHLHLHCSPFYPL